MFARLALAALVSIPPAAHAQPSAPTPAAVEAARGDAALRKDAAAAAIEAARNAAAEERRLAERRVALARAVQSSEARLDAAVKAAQDAQSAADAAETDLHTRVAALSPLAPVMLRLAIWPAESLLAAPGDPADTIRGLAVLQGLARQVVTEAAALRQAEAVARAQAAAAQRVSAAQRDAEAALRSAAAALDAALADAQKQRARAEGTEAAATRRAAEAAAKAETLTKALARLQGEDARRVAHRPAAPLEPEQPALPVAGKVTRAFGTPTEAGPAQGLTLAAAPGARVTSPCGGRAVFAGPFRSFGLLLIVECRDGYHFVLAGLDRVDIGVGQRLLAGEPVGQMPRFESRARALLYLELRRDGQPIDPRSWFAGLATVE